MNSCVIFLFYTYWHWKKLFWISISLSLPMYIVICCQSWGRGRGSRWEAKVGTWLQHIGCQPNNTIWPSQQNPPYQTLEISPLSLVFLSPPFLEALVATRSTLESGDVLERRLWFSKHDYDTAFKRLKAEGKTYANHSLTSVRCSIYGGVLWHAADCMYCSLLWYCNWDRRCLIGLS